jgi:hypothetical protein
MAQSEWDQDMKVEKMFDHCTYEKEIFDNILDRESWHIQNILEG